MTVLYWVRKYICRSTLVYNVNILSTWEILFYTFRHKIAACCLTHALEKNKPFHYMSWDYKKEIMRIYLSHCVPYIHTLWPTFTTFASMCILAPSSIKFILANLFSGVHFKWQDKLMKDEQVLPVRFYLIFYSPLNFKKLPVAGTHR